MVLLSGADRHAEFPVEGQILAIRHRGKHPGRCGVDARREGRFIAVAPESASCHLARRRVRHEIGETGQLEGPPSISTPEQTDVRGCDEVLLLRVAGQLVVVPYRGDVQTRSAPAGAAIGCHGVRVALSPRGLVCREIPCATCVA